MSTPPAAVEHRKQFLINTAYFVVVALLVYGVIRYVLGWILPFLLAFCIVSAVRPVIELLNRKLKVRHSVVPIIVMLLAYTVVAGLVFGLFMQLFALARNLFIQLPDYYQNSIYPTMTNVWNNINAFFFQLPQEWQVQVGNYQETVMDAIQSALVSISQSGISWLSSLTASVPAFFIAFLFTIMLSFFISVQYDKVMAFFRGQLPRRAMRVMHDLKVVLVDTLFRYIRACLKLMFITFVELSLGLLFLRTPNALLIAAGIAVFDALPVFGTGAIMIPWVLLELIQGNLYYALGLGILYGIVTVIRNIIEPKIVGDKLGLNPIASMVSIYAGFRVMGVFGMIIMPIVTQILLELHRRGSITLMRRKPDEQSQTNVR